MTATNAAGRHGGSTRLSHRLSRCALKAANATRSAKRVLKPTPEPPDEPAPLGGAGAGAGEFDSPPAGEVGELLGVSDGSIPPRSGSEIESKMLDNGWCRTPNGPALEPLPEASPRVRADPGT